MPFFARSLTLVHRSSCSLLLNVNRTETLATQAIIRPNTLTGLFITIFLDISEAIISDVFVRIALHRHIFVCAFILTFEFFDEILWLTIKSEKEIFFLKFLFFLILLKGKSESFGISSEIILSQNIKVTYNKPCLHAKVD